MRSSIHHTHSMPRDRRRGLTTQSNVGKPISTQLLFVGSDTNRSLHATGCWSSCQDRPVEVEAHKWPLPDQLRKVWDNLITAAASGALQLLIGGIEARAVPRTNAVRLPTTPQGRRTRAIRFPPSGQRRLRGREAATRTTGCTLISFRCARSGEGRNGLGCPSVSANNRVRHRHRSQLRAKPNPDRSRNPSCGLTERQRWFRKSPREGRIGHVALETRAADSDYGSADRDLLPRGETRTRSSAVRQLQ